jgi:glutamate formiminotransferase
MRDAVIECVPNFAAGRDEEAVRAIIAAMRLPGVYLLGVAQSTAQDRTLVTLAGDPTAVCEAVTRAAGVATARIDLTRNDLTHNDQTRPGTKQGPSHPLHPVHPVHPLHPVHPRIGATDVIPIVPIRDISLSECAGLAREIANSLWSRYSLPSYLYAAAASRPDRVSLEAVREGQFEGLREAVLRDSGRRPDVGGPGLHPSAGAVAVGARRVLIEYRLSLVRGDIRIARSIVRDLRGAASSVRAAAVLADGEPQLWLQIAEFQQMSVGAVYAQISMLAAKHKAEIGAGEIIGLLPEAAYEPGSAWVAQLRGFAPDAHILERRLVHPMDWPA